MAVFDASFLIDLLRDRPGALAVIDRLEETGEPWLAPAAAVYEVATELGRRRTPAARARRLGSLLGEVTVVPFGRELAFAAGDLAGVLHDAGGPADDVDCMIAATALALEQRLVTRNRKHFERVPGLRIVAY